MLYSIPSAKNKRKNYLVDKRESEDKGGNKRDFPIALTKTYQPDGCKPF